LQCTSPVPLGRCQIAMVRVDLGNMQISVVSQEVARIPLGMELTLANLCCFGCWPVLLYLEDYRGIRVLGNQDEVRVVAIDICG
jgi:hypothetical protein